MPEVSTLLLFAAAALAMLLIPGPSVLYIVTRSVAQGRGAGLVSVLGIHVGSAVHVAAAVFGLSALLASSATAFTIVKYLGVAYLVWLGIQQLRSRSYETEPERAAPASARRTFGEGVLVNVLNPKTAIFFLAFLPQFTDPARGPMWLQLAVLGACFIGLGMVTDGAYALTAGALAGRLRRTLRARRRLNRASGAVYLGMGLTAALTGEARS